MHLFVGLGNPGNKYENNRHNAGVMAVTELAKKHKLAFSTEKAFEARIARGTIDGQEVLLALPDTFMNDSGRSVARLVKQFSDASLTVLYDDIDILLGTVKCSFARGAGGHNGVQSIIETLGTNEFFRIRIGVRPTDERLLSHIAPPDGFEKFLLTNFTLLEADGLKEGIEKANAIAEFLSAHSKEETMTKYN